MKNKIETHVGSYVIIKTSGSRRTISGVLQKKGQTFFVKLGVKILPVDIEKITSLTCLS